MYTLSIEKLKLCQLPRVEGMEEARNRMQARYAEAALEWRKKQDELVSYYGKPQKKCSSTSVQATKRGGGGKAGPRRKNTFFWKLLNRKKNNVPMPCKLDGGGGGKALVAWPLVEDLFFASSLSRMNDSMYEYTND